jgi:hypothetical protein
MKKALGLLVLLLAAALSVQAQEKGVDQQNERIRDGSNNRQPAVNGGNVGVGTGRGMDFGRGRTIAPPPLENPYRLTARKDAVIEAVQELMRERKLILDESVSNLENGVLISQPYTFVRGGVIARSELSQFAEIPVADVRGWTRGRYTMIVEVLPVDGTTTRVSVNARVEGRSEGVTGAEWVTLRSTGNAEESFLVSLVEKLTGGPPPGREETTTTP